MKAIRGRIFTPMVIDRTWSDDHRVGIQGWVKTDFISAKTARIQVDGSDPVTFPLPPVSPSSGRKGRFFFEAVVPRTVVHTVRMTLCGDPHPKQYTAVSPGRPPLSPSGYVDKGGLYDGFFETVNQMASPRVLEIGSRVVSPGSRSRRALFGPHVQYTGLDYYPDANTDVVGDAHELHRFFPPESFDAVFSISVLEHLAMPWVAADEMARVLKPGGITFHTTHFAWPEHEAPWDFWRFSDTGLQVLFSPPLGFTVLDAGYFSPLRMHLDRTGPGQEMLAMDPGYGGVAILAQKTGEWQAGRFQWPASTHSVVPAGTRYPTPEE